MSSYISNVLERTRKLPLASLHGLSPVMVTVLATALPLGTLAFRGLRSSYLEYLSNGPGGVGQHVTGWLQVLALRLIIWFNGVDGFDLTIYEEEIAAGETRSWLSDDLPEREGDRPVLKVFPLPQRHVVTQQDPGLGAAEIAIFTSISEAHPTSIIFRNSHLEAFGPALHLQPSLIASSSLPLLHKGEFAHIHVAPYSFPTPLPSLTSIRLTASSYTSSNDEKKYTPDPLPGPQSVHVTLSPKDAILAIKRGWAIRHAASGKPPKPIPRLASGYVLIWAPRNAGDLDVLTKLVRASAGFVARTEAPLRP